MRSFAPFLADLSVGAVGTAVGASVSDFTALVTASASAVYLVCKGLVLVIREYRKRK